MEKKLVIQVLAMPKDTNSSGDIFGGWLLGMMDLGGGILAGEYVGPTSAIGEKLRVATVALDGMSFVKPLFVGDVLKVYASVQHIGNTSITILVEAYATRRDRATEKITQGNFKYVCIDEYRKPRTITKPKETTYVDVWEIPDKESK
jgi:acyl-CoA thioesterase YciA